MINMDEKIILNDSTKNKLKVLYRNSSMFLDKKLYYLIENNDLTKSSLDEAIRVIMNSIREYKGYSLARYDKQLVKEFNDLMLEFDKLDIKYVKDNLEKSIDLFYSVFNANKRIYLFRDLINAKDDILIDMKYYKTLEEINKFNDKYEDAIKDKNIDKMQELLSNEQNLILKEWEKLDKNIDEMTDDNFCFIGHSTISENFKDNFNGNFISCSLYNQNNNDTYRNGFGFIFKPKNIIAAQSNDMFTNNYAIDSENIFNYTSLKRVNHPQRLLDECLKLRNQNLEKNDFRKVFSEVVLNKFDPIGIFCFTNGSLEYDYNYRTAFELQKNFPNLKIKIFDTMKYKKNEMLDREKIKVLNSIESKNNIFHNSYKEEHLPRYEMFFRLFDKLKQTKNYDRQDIENIYMLNKKLIINTSIDEIFSGEYSDDLIKYVLGKGYNFNIDYILSGDITIYNLTNLEKLSSYKNRLNKYYPCLEEFVSILPRIVINQEMINEIKKEKDLNFGLIIKILSKYVITDINNKEEELNKDIEQYNNELEELIKQKDKQEEYRKYENIVLNEFWFKSIKDDYDQTINLKKENDETLKELSFHKSMLEKSIDNQNSRKQSILSSKYSNIDIDEKIELKTMQQQELEKSKFLKIFRLGKINKIKNSINGLKQQKIKEERNYNLRNKEELIKIEVDLEVAKSTLNDIDDDLNRTLEIKNDINNSFNNIKSKLFEYYYCDEIDKIESIIQEAKEYTKNNKLVYNYSIELDIENVKRRIEDIKSELSKLKEEKSSLGM